MYVLIGIMGTNWEMHVEVTRRPLFFLQEGMLLWQRRPSPPDEGLGQDVWHGMHRRLQAQVWRLPLRQHLPDRTGQ